MRHSFSSRLGGRGMLGKDCDRYLLMYHERRFPAVLQYCTFFGKIPRRIGGAFGSIRAAFLGQPLWRTCGDERCLDMPANCHIIRSLL